MVADLLASRSACRWLASNKMSCPKTPLNHGKRAMASGEFFESVANWLVENLSKFASLPLSREA